MNENFVCDACCHHLGAVGGKKIIRCTFWVTRNFIPHAVDIYCWVIIISNNTVSQGINHDVLREKLLYILVRPPLPWSHVHIHKISLGMHVGLKWIMQCKVVQCDMQIKARRAQLL